MICVNLGLMEKLDITQINTALAPIGGWSLQDGYIAKTYTFKDFKTAFSTMVRIAFECEQLNHHPDWENVYNTLKIRLSTHDAGGVTQKDIELAGRIESIVKA